MESTEFTSLRSIKLDFRFDAHGHELDFGPGSLACSERLVSTHQLFLRVECFNDDTDEKLNEKHANDNDKDHGVDDHKPIVVLDGLKVGAYSVN